MLDGKTANYCGSLILKVAKLWTAAAGESGNGNVAGSGMITKLNVVILKVFIMTHQQRGTDQLVLLQKETQ